MGECRAEDKGIVWVDPVLRSLSDLAFGYDDCNSGSNASFKNCDTGYVAGDNCNMGGSAGDNCNNGTMASTNCNAGGVASSSCNPGTTGHY